MGIAVVQVGSKTNLAIPWAILEELGIPSFVVFDGDHGTEARSKNNGKHEQEILLDVRNATRWNRNLLSLLGAPKEDWPATGVYPKYAVFHDRLEDEMQKHWSGMVEFAESLKAESNEWRPKSEDCYRQAAREVEGAVPKFATDIVTSVRALL